MWTPWRKNIPGMQNTAGPPYPLFCIRQFSQSPFDLLMRRADCNRPFYIRDLSLRGFWYTRGSWNQSPMDTEERLIVVWTNERSLKQHNHSREIKVTLQGLWGNAMLSFGWTWEIICGAADTDARIPPPKAWDVIGVWCNLATGIFKSPQVTQIYCRGWEHWLVPGSLAHQLTCASESPGGLVKTGLHLQSFWFKRSRVGLNKMHPTSFQVLLMLQGRDHTLRTTGVASMGSMWPWLNPEYPSRRTGKQSKALE